MAGGGGGAARNGSASLHLSSAATHSEKRPRTPRRTLKVAGLFSGIGGIELGLHRSGHQTALLCENDPSARAVLEARFPGIPCESDICRLGTLPKDVDLLTAGFPCQDLSQAGATAGIEGARSGLIGEVFRLLRRRRIPWILVENVPFMLHLGRGRALEFIIGGLEDLGYSWAYRVVDTMAFGLPQRRERVFLVATNTGEDPRGVLFADEKGPPDLPEASPDLAYGFFWTEGVRGLGSAIDAVPTLKGGSTIGIPSPPAILLPSGDVVTPGIRDAERMQGFRADWTKPAETAGRASYRWKLVGNAVTVRVAKWLGDRLARPGAYDRGGWDTKLPVGSRWPRAAWNIGAGRFSAERSAWPVRTGRRPIEDFLREPRLLSARATAGFLSRLRQGSLRRPDGFEAALEAHLARMNRIDAGEEEPPKGDARGRRGAVRKAAAGR